MNGGLPTLLEKIEKPILNQPRMRKIWVVLICSYINKRKLINQPKIFYSKSIVKDNLPSSTKPWPQHRIWFQEYSLFLGDLCTKEPKKWKGSDRNT